MSLALLQGYSSAEEEEVDDPIHFPNSSEDDGGDDERPRRPFSAGSPLLDVPKPSSNLSGLPSAFDAFSEVNRLSIPRVFLRVVRLGFEFGKRGICFGLRFLSVTQTVWKRTRN